MNHYAEVKSKRVNVTAMAEDYTGGMSLIQCGHKHGISKVTVASLLREYGVKFRCKGDRITPRNKRKDAMPKTGRNPHAKKSLAALDKERKEREDRAHGKMLPMEHIETPEEWGKRKHAHLMAMLDGLLGKETKLKAVK